MKDYESLQKICIAEVKAAGITPGNIVEWSINRTANRRWGQCRKRGNKYYINISYKLLEDDRVSEKACKETIIHEILHSVHDGMGHKGKWKRCAAIMNHKYGYNIKRVTSSAEMGLSSKPVRIKKEEDLDWDDYKYILKCRYCGYAMGFHRYCKTVRYYRNYSCRRCTSKRAFDKYC